MDFGLECIRVDVAEAALLFYGTSISIKLLTPAIKLTSVASKTKVCLRDLPNLE